MDLISRAGWQAPAWAGSPAVVPLSSRRDFFVHWYGSPPSIDRGPGLVRAVDRMHRGQGWAGVGYNFVVDQDGRVWEGRGWNRQGAHCPGHNVSGIGVLVAVGKGGPSATPEALTAVRDLYDEACRRTGRALDMRGHRDGIATECPGGELYAWVRAGMPRPGGGAATHTVEPDQTMWSISQQHGVDLDALRAANPKVREDRIFPDDVLTIPKAGAPAPKPPAPKPTPPARPVVSLARLVQAARVDPPKRGTPVSYSPTRVVEDALAKEGLLTRSLVDGHFGTATVSAYAAWQRRLGYRGRDADGIPGRASLNALAKKYGFTTTN